MLETGNIAGSSILTAQGAGQSQNTVTDIRVHLTQFLIDLMEQQVIQKTVLVFGALILLQEQVQDAVCSCS